MKHIKLFEQYKVNEGVVAETIDKELKSKNLKGMVATNVNNPQDDILKNKVDYVTFTTKSGDGNTYTSVYMNNKPENMAIAKEIVSKYKGELSSSYGGGKFIGVTKILEK
jgi:hypothetical protein